MTMISLTNDLMSLTDFSEKCFAYTLPNKRKAFISKSQTEFRQDENGVVTLFVADWMVSKLHAEHKPSSFIFLHAPKPNEGQSRFGDLVANKPVVEVVEEKTETVAAKIKKSIKNNTITTDLVVGDMVNFEKEFSKKLSQEETSEFTGQYGNPDFIRKQIIGFLAEKGEVVEIVKRKTKKSAPAKIGSMSRQRIFKNNLIVKTSNGKSIELDVQFDTISKI